MVVVSAGAREREGVQDPGSQFCSSAGAPPGQQVEKE